jgi:hypothetical protein
MEKVALTHRTRDRARKANLKTTSPSLQEKKGNGKTKKDTRKWCEFHKIPWHNTDECRLK